MQRLFFVVIIAIVVIGLPPLVLSDTAISAGDAGIPNNEVTSSIGTTSNFSASATVTITMTGILDD